MKSLGRCFYSNLQGRPKFSHFVFNYYWLKDILESGNHLQIYQCGFYFYSKLNTFPFGVSILFVVLMQGLFLFILFFYWV